MRCRPGCSPLPFPAASHVAFPIDAVAQHLPPMVVDAASQGLAEAFGDADGALVLRVDETDDAVPPPAGEGVLQGGPCRLGGIAEPPPATRQLPGELQA